MIIPNSNDKFRVVKLGIRVHHGQQQNMEVGCKLWVGEKKIPRSPAHQ